MIEKLIYLKPATRNDLFRLEMPIENKIYFERSRITGQFCGPYEISMEMDLCDIVVKLHMKVPMIYVLHHEHSDSTLAFFLKMKVATAEDFTLPHKVLKLDATYFIESEKGFIGPARTYPTLDKQDFHKNILAKRIFIIARANVQEFIEINTISHAS